jgi:hypothetical protein
VSPRPHAGRGASDPTRGVELARMHALLQRLFVAALQGTIWYLRLTEADRQHWHAAARSDDPYDAWIACLKGRGATD